MPTQNENMESTHGHEVMRMMVETGFTYTRESLITAIRERFGAEARFHTCSDEEMNAEALVAFLESRGKFSGSADSMSMKPESICDHD